jgi:hypothetical protein
MRRVYAAAVAVAASAIVGVCVSPCPGWAGDDEELHAILFSGRDLWRNGVFTHGGLLLSPGDIDEDGIRLKLLSSGGLYRYNAGSLGGQQVIGAEATLQVMPGFQVTHGRLTTKFFFGLDFEEHRLWPYDPGNSLRGHDIGMRMASDFWYEPSDKTMMVLEASLSTIATNQSARAAYGWRVLDDQFYFGPELAFFGSDGYRHLRIGGHLTGLKTDNTQWSAAAGWAVDSDRRSSPYVRLGLMQKM